MRCTRCEFENIPGQTRCLRCGSILEAAGQVTEIYPPRMPAWRKPWRDMMRALRGWRIVSERSRVARVRQRLEPVASDALVGLVLSVIPGFAHLLNRRLREVRWLVPLWLVVLGGGLYLYGSPAGALLIGLAIAIHAWIGIKYGIFQEISEFSARIGIALVVLVLLAVLYWATPRLVVPRLTTGYTALAIPALHVRPGTCFMVWRMEGAREPLPRGTLVLIRPSVLRVGRGEREAHATRPMVGQIAGLPGETIEIEGGAFRVGQQHLDPSRFPVPRWVPQRGRRIVVPIPDDSYFVSSEYAIGGHANVGINNQVIRDACVVKAADLRGRAFLLWWPLRERRFIE